MAVTSSMTTDFAYVSFFDVTNPATPCLMGNKIVTANPQSELFEAAKRGAYHIFGVARGIATIRHAEGIAAYAAIADAGLVVASVGPNIPEKIPSQRQTEGILPGNYMDVAATGNRLLALNRGSRELQVIDPTLAVLATVQLPEKAGPPRRIVLSQAFPFDLNNNKAIESGESIHAAFIGCDKGIVMADISNLSTPRVLGLIQMPAEIKDLDVDRGRRRLVTIDVKSALHFVDVARIQASFADVNLDGLDDRIIWSQTFTDIPDVVRVDTQRPYIYVGRPRGLDVIGVGAPTLTGTATYTHYPVANLPQFGITGVDYAGVSRKKIRGAVVELRTAAGSLVDTTTTDDNGFYSFDAPLSVPLRVIVKAALGRPGDIALDVVDNFEGDHVAGSVDGLELVGPEHVYAKASPLFTVTTNTTVNVFAETHWTPGDSPVSGRYDLREAAPFAILDTVYQAVKVIRRADGGVAFPKLHIAWSARNAPCSPCALTGQAAIAAGQIGAARYSAADGTLYLMGAENVDTDEYDTLVILREWSHYFQQKIGRDDSIGGPHKPGDVLDPRVAFSEGFATAHAAMLAGSKQFLASSGPDQATVRVLDLERDSIPNPANPALATARSGWWAEDAVIELLWDLFDGKSAPSAPERDAETDGTIEDKVELGYKPIYQGLVAQKTTRAFTTIFSFMKAVVTPFLADAEKRAATGDPILALARAEGVELVGANEFEGAAAADRLYTVLPTDGTVVEEHGEGPFAGEPLQTRNVNDPGKVGNRLHDQVFFKFTAATAGTYDIEVIPTNDKAMSIVVNDRGKKTSSQTGDLGETQRLSVVVLAPGDCTVAVSARDFVGGAWTNTTEATFTIAVTFRAATQ